MHVFLKVVIRSYIFLNNVVVYFSDKVDGKQIIKTYSVAKILLSLLFKATSCGTAKQSYPKTRIRAMPTVKKK